MPISRITTNFKLSSPEQFISDYQDILIEHLGILPNDRLVLLDQKDNGFYQPTDTAGNYIIIEINLFPGRSVEAKRHLYQNLVGLAKKYDVSKMNLRIFLNEIIKENWGVRGGQMGSEIELGYNID